MQTDTQTTKKTKISRQGYMLIFLFAILIATISLKTFGVLDLFENKFVDFRFSLFNQNLKPSKDIIFVDINEESLEKMSSEIGGWPWPRGGIITEMITDYIMLGDPAGFLFDVLYPQYSPKSPLEDIPNEDLVLTDAAAAYDSISHAVLFNEDKSLENQESPEFFAENFAIRVDDSKSTLQLPSYTEIIKPFSPLDEEAAHLHAVNHDEDKDGVSRKAKLFIKHGGVYYPGLALRALIQKINASNFEIVGRKFIINESSRGKIVVPLDKRGDFPINFYKNLEKLETISAVSIIKSYQQMMNGEAEPQTSFEEFSDKIVVLGSSASGLKDIKVTPMGIMPGPYIHICAISNILENQTISHMPEFINFTFILFSLLLIILITTRFKNPIIKNSFGFIYITTYVLFGFLAFKYYALIIDITYMLVLGVVAYLGSLAYLSLTEARDKQFLKATFGSYLAPELIDKMFSEKSMPTLGGESKQISAYFTDIQGFSTFSEKLTAVQLVELLNEYLSAMTDILLDGMGTLDKYEGDAIIAFFGAPMSVPDHPLRACFAAIAMQAKLLKLCDKWTLEKKNPDEPERNVKNFPESQWAPGDKWPKIVHEMKMRIGINTGEIVVGNMGSATRMNYTMMGDSVNLAARLEAGAKQYGVYTLASEFTINYKFLDETTNEERRVGDFLEYRYIDKIVVVGKSEPVIVYEIVARKGELSDAEKKLFIVYREALTAYLNRQWDVALDKFKEASLIERFPEAKINPSKVYIERCEHYQKSPPQDGWDGTWVLTSK